MRFAKIACLLMLTGCEALTAAAPIAYSATEQLIRQRMRSASAQQAADLAEALALLEAMRAEVERAQAAKAKAEQAARDARQSAEMAQAQAESAEASAKAAALEREFAARFARAFAATSGPTVELAPEHEPAH